MSPLVILVVCATLAGCAEPPSSDNNGSAREEKLRSALIDAFQNIKKASAKGGLDEEDPLNSDLIGSIGPPDSSLSRNEKSTTEDNFDLFSDDDGLSFADLGDVRSERRNPSTEKSHNVQHIVKTTTKPIEKTTKPSKDVFSKLNDSIRTTVNESRRAQKEDNATELLGIENMLRIFDADILVSQWTDIQKKVSGKCKDNMEDYVQGLKERQLWALKSKSSFPIYIYEFINASWLHRILSTINVKFANKFPNRGLCKN